MEKLYKEFIDEYNRLSSKALNYSLLTVISQLVFTPIIILLITKKMSPEEQGYYYTFLSLVALQSFFELGLFTYVLNKSSAFFSDLQEFNIRFLEQSGIVKSNLAMLYRMTRKIYFIITFLFLICIGCFGLVFFADSNILEINHTQWVWLGFTILCAIQLFYLGLNGFLEGCGQIERMEKFKLIAFILSSITLIASLGLGLGLVSLCLSFIPRVLKDVYLIHFVFGKEFKLLACTKSSTSFSFMTSVAPMQFRLAISGIFSYLQYNALVPMVFTVLGPAHAGIIGVGLQVTSFLQQILTRWTHIQQPRMAKLVSLKKFSELDALVKGVQALTIKLSVLMILGFILLFTILKAFEVQILDRVPNFVVFLMLIVAASAYGQASIRVGYLRAFVEERAYVMSVISSVANAVICYVLLEHIGLYAVSFSYLFAILFVALPWSQFLVRRKKDELDQIVRLSVK